jgi:hypothetical protein
MVSATLGVYPPEVLTRFWAGIDKTESCWLWTKSRETKGYGNMRALNKTRKVHRMSWEIHYGSIPAGLSVCHHCDVRNCVNPKHLFTGTQQDNMADMVRKGRAARAGLPSFNARLTPTQVVHLRWMSECGYSRANIAAVFGISKTQYHRITRRAPGGWVSL